MPTHWAVAAPFFAEGQPNRWILDDVPGDRHAFTPIAPPPVPAGMRLGGEQTTVPGWRRMWRQTTRIFDDRPDGIVTVFPQLPAIVGLRKRVRRRDVPVVAWCFNVGKIYAGAKGHLARYGLRSIDRFVCHSRAECDRYSHWLGLPRERFEFVPLQRGEPGQADVRPDDVEPFVLSMGSSGRDYRTLFRAVERLGLPTIVVAAPYAVAGLRVPTNVEVRSNQSWDECTRLARAARVNVVSVLNDETASGQVTLIQAMRMNQPIVATRCIGTEDYVDDGITGLLVPPGDDDAMAAAIRALWDDAALRRRLGDAAGAHARQAFTDAAAGASLARVLDDVMAGRA